MPHRFRPTSPAHQGRAALRRPCSHSRADAIEKHSGKLLIEGVGGIVVPLNDRHTVLDWMIALNVPLVLVTGTYLGTLSHTLTCIDVLKRRDFPSRHWW